MSEENSIRIEEVESVAPPPKARVEDAETAPEKLERKRDYLRAFWPPSPPRSIRTASAATCTKPSSRRSRIFTIRKFR